MTIATPAVDRRCLEDGAYSHDSRELYRCVGMHRDRRARIGFETSDGAVRWVKPTSLLVQRLEFVCQGDPTTVREIEAMT